MDANEAIVRRYLDAVWNKGDTTAIADLVGEGYRAGGELAVLFPPPYEGRAGVEARLQSVREAFGDFHITLGEVRSHGDQVEVEWTATCTHRGTFLSYPPTGRRITVTGSSAFRLRDGKIVERHGHMDRLGLIRQLQGKAE
jgi:steroid delta-isomerase-like uncharacterized protein